MGKATIWFMNARAKRFLESTAIKGRLILEHSGWLNHLSPGDIVAIKTHMGEAYNVGYLRPMQKIILWPANRRSNQLEAPEEVVETDYS